MRAELVTPQAMVDRFESEWHEGLRALLPEIHPVDRDATRVWLAFWPAKLRRPIETGEDLREVERRWKLDGRYRLEDVLEESLGFLYGARYWEAIQQAACTILAERPTSLEAAARRIASEAARRSGVGADLLLGAAFAAAVAARQVGLERVARPAARHAGRRPDRSPEQVLRLRRGRKVWLLRRRHRVIWDEARPRERSFFALEGQNLTMAAAEDRRDYRKLDSRRVEGPIPVQCRSGQCGYCWIGILGGREHVSPVTAYEAQQLEHFGYAGSVDPAEPHPPVRLACQCSVHGDLSIVIPPWNGVLYGRGSVPRPQYSAAMG